MRRSISLTAIGTVRGRVRGDELCLNPIERELADLLDLDLAGQSPGFSQVHLTIHLGESFIKPKVWRRLDPVLGLMVAVGAPMVAVRRKPLSEVCPVVRLVATQAVIEALSARKLACPRLQALRGELGPWPADS